jgi:hypothetical protein
MTARDPKICQKGRRTDIRECECNVGFADRKVISPECQRFL